MHDTRRHSAWILLLAFVAGGLLAPSVHLLQHAQEAREQLAAEVVQHQGHAHDAPGFETSTPSYESLVCPPYHNIFSGLHMQGPSVARARVGAPLVVPPISHLTGTSLRRSAIRGPPVVHG